MAPIGKAEAEVDVLVAGTVDGCAVVGAAAAVPVGNAEVAVDVLLTGAVDDCKVVGAVAVLPESIRGSIAFSL